MIQKEHERLAVLVCFTLLMTQVILCTPTLQGSQLPQEAPCKETTHRLVENMNVYSCTENQVAYFEELPTGQDRAHEVWLRCQCLLAHNLICTTE